MPNYAIGMATGMAVGSMLASDDASADTTTAIKIEMCKQKATHAETIACLQQVKKDNDQDNKNGMEFAAGSLIVVLLLVVFFAWLADH